LGVKLGGNLGVNVIKHKIVALSDLSDHGRRRIRLEAQPLSSRHCGSDCYPA
jgi:hypothetical protein